MPNFAITDLAPVTLPIDAANTFFELEATEGGVQVSRRISAANLGIGGSVNTVNSGVNITVDNTDPLNPIINLDAALAGVSVNGVTLQTAGSATNFLNELGNYVAVSVSQTLQEAYDGGQSILINATPDPILLTASVAGRVFEIQDTVGGIVMQVIDTGVIAGDPGLEASGINIGGTIYDSVFKASDIGGTNIAQSILHRHSSSFGPFIVGARSQGDTSAHVIVNDGDELFRVWGAGWDGGTYEVGASMAFRVDGTPGIDDMPGEIVWSTTPVGSATVTERMRLRNDGQLEIDFNLTLLERAAAFASAAGRGQIWVRNDTPNVLVFTDDTGADTVLGGGITIVGIPANNQLAVWTGAAALEGESELTFNNSELTLAGSQAQITIDEQDGGGAAMLVVTSTATADSGVALRFDSSSGTIAFLQQITSGGTLQDIWIRMLEDGAVEQYFNGAIMTRTVAIGSGGFEVNNTVTGAGFERVLTTSDIGIGAGDNIDFTGTIQFSNVLGVTFETSCEIQMRNNADDSTTFIQNIGPTLQLGIAGGDFGDGIFELGSSWSHLKMNRAIVFDEQSSAPVTSVGGDGQLWVRDDTPNVLMFTDDAGTDHVLAFV